MSRVRKRTNSTKRCQRLLSRSPLWNRQMRTGEIASVAIAVVVLAGFAVAFKPGSAAPAVLNASGGAASNVIKAAAYGT